MNKDTFAGRVPPWRNIKDSTVFDKDAEISTSLMLKRAGLADWNVQTLPIGDVVRSEFITTDNQFVTVRDTDSGQPQIIGHVKSKYHPLQNEQAFDWADNILDGGGSWDTAGSFGFSSKVFGSMLIDENTISVDRNGLNDEVTLFLLISNSHDGSLPLQCSITPVRVRCQNTFQLALNSIAKSEVPQTFKIRHTSSAQLKVEIAREALRMSFQYAEDFNNLANDLFTRKVSGQKFEDIIKHLYPKPAEGQSKGDKVAKTRWENTISLLHDIRLSPTNEGIAYTGWGAYNILTERIDWFKQSTNEETKALAASGFSVTANAEKNRILNTILAATA